MAYKALYRAYRPQRFEEVVGQQHVVRTLQNAIKTNKIAHAYLFCGPRGTGKTTIAKILAKAINCECGDVNIVPCDQCDNCKAITEGSHPDVIEIDAASNNGVDEVRDLIEKVKYAPINGKYKVYIIDEVHMMSSGAFNALLKTLEEPPSHVVFVLATTEPQKILPTIISRCQRFDFNKISNNDIVKRLQIVLDDEGIEYTQEALKLIGSLADGGMRDALSITEQCLAYANKVDEISLNEIYGIISNREKIEFIKLLISKNVTGLLAKMEQFFQTGIDIKRLTSDLIDILKDVIIYKNTNNVDTLFVLHEEDINEIKPYITSEEAFAFIDILLKADQQYKFATNPSLYFELAVLKIANKDHGTIQKTVTEAKVEIPQKPIPAKKPVYDSLPKFEKIDPVVLDTKEEPSITPVIEAKQEQPKIVNSTIEVDIMDIMSILVQAQRTIMIAIQEKWSIIKKYSFNVNTAKWAGMLQSGRVVAAGEKGFIIAFNHQPEVNQVNDTNNYYQLKQFLTEVLGSEYDFIAVNANKWQEIRQTFITYKKNNMLPTSGKITLKHIKEQKEPELTDAQKLGLKLFGDLVEFEEGE